MNPKDIVKQGYDRISHAYRADDAEVEGSDYAAWLDELIPLLEEGVPVLDLGCGCGLPATLILSHHFQATGVDLSPVQIERARKLVPDARFLCADMTALDFPPESFAAIVSLYAIIHVPLAEQLPLLHRLSRWLRPGGYLLLTAGHTSWTGTEENWLDVKGGTMYWSHADAATYRRWLASLGFSLLHERFIPEDDSGHSLFLARKDRTPQVP